MKFLIRIFSPSCLLVSIFFLIYVFYKSQIYWGNLSNIYLVYYTISIFLIFFSISTFFVNETIKEYLIISIFSIMISFYSFEGYLKLNKKVPKWQNEKKSIYEKITGKKYDTRTTVEIYNDLKKKDKEIKISLAPLIHFYPNYSVFPLSNVSNSQTIFCNENGYYSIYLSDRYGFNNPDIEWDSEEIEYLIVGDSFAHGACMNRPEDMASVLRLLSNKSVLNLGYSANGPLIEYATLKEYLLPKVKKILWIYHEGNDFDDLKNELKHKTLNKYLKNYNFKQNLIFKQKEINKLANIKIKKAVDIRYRIKNFIFLSESRNFFISFYKSKNKKKYLEEKNKLEIPKQFVDILKLTKDLVKKNDSKLYFVFLPRVPEQGKYNNLTYDNTLYLLVKNKVKELDIPFIDIKKLLFDKEPNVLKFFPLETIGGHYNAKGYKKIAETIYNLTKN